MKPSKEARQEDIFIVNTGLSTCSCKIRVRQLEKAVADQFLSHEIDKSYLEIACERAGIDDIDDFKKKVGGRRGNAPRKGSQTNTDV